MKNILKTLLISIAISATTLFAGAGHDHGHGHSHSSEKVGETKIKQLADRQLKRLVKHNKIEESWSNQSINSMEKKQYGHNMEWVVLYKNLSAKDAQKRNLYVFITEYGEVTGANHSGQ